MDTSMLKEKLMKFVFPVIAVFALLVAGYFYSQVRTLKQNPQTIAVQEVKDLVAKVSQLIVLPAGETPTVATVSDPAALKDQAFFNGSVKGDKVLIYTNAKKAILYSPTLNKIVEVAPLNIGDTKGVTAPAPTPEVKTPTPAPVKK